MYELPGMNHIRKIHSHSLSAGLVEIISLYIKAFFRIPTGENQTASEVIRISFRNCETKGNSGQNSQ